MISKRLKFNDTVKVGKPKTPYQMIKKVFKQLQIDSVALNDISLNYIDKNKAGTKQTRLEHLDIAVSDIYIDSLSGQDPKRFYYTKDINVTVHNYHLGTPDGLYNVKLKKIFSLLLSAGYNLIMYHFYPSTTGVIFIHRWEKPAICTT